MKCMEKPAARKTTDGIDPKQAKKQVYKPYIPHFIIQHRTENCNLYSQKGSKFTKNSNENVGTFALPFREKHEKNRENAMRKPPMDDCGAKKPYPFRKNRYGLAGTGGMPRGRARRSGDHCTSSGSEVVLWTVTVCA